MNVWQNSICCFLVALSAAVLFYHQKCFMQHDDSTRKKNEDFPFILGILSARENFKQREALRKTWLKLVEENATRNSKNRVLHKFIIGSQDCEIPPEDRINQYTCEWDPYISTNQDGETVAYKLSEDSQIGWRKKSIGLDFEVIHPIVITKLGILVRNYESIKKESPRVSIFDTVSKTEIVFTTFDERDADAKDASNISDVKNGFLFKAADNYLLPKEFKGTFVVDGSGQDFLVAKSNGSCLVNDGNGLIRFKKITRHSFLTGFFPVDIEESDSFCAVIAGSFAYLPYGMGNCKPGYSVSQVNARLERINDKEKMLKSQMNLLERENKAYGDIFFVDLKDVYRNIPLKLLKFYKWVEAQFEFNFTIKTDDDCFLNVPKIIEVLKTTPVDASEKNWYGNFRFDWPLDKFGKWAEHQYTASVYPAFACGSGYVLAREAIKWIAVNSEHLHAYQGEDVSTGIWLSAIKPIFVKDKRWSCYKICNREMLSLPNNKPEELLSLYDNQLLCGNPCGCSS